MGPGGGACCAEPGVHQVIEYKSTRDVETFSKFLDNGGELPAEEPTEEPTAPFPVGARPKVAVSGPVALGLPVAGVKQGCSFQLGLCLQDTPANASAEPKEEL